MLKLTTDWVNDIESGGEPVPEGRDGDVVVEVVREVGPSGWPEIAVYAPDGPTLWAWLREVYGADEDMASELAGLADSV